MRRSCLFLLTVISMPVSAFSQTSGTRPTQSICSLVEAPAIRGIKLGMKAEDILSLLPEGNETQINKRAIALAAGPPNYGVARLSYRRFSHPSPIVERFVGVDSIEVTLFDGHVVDFSVTYAGPNSYATGPAWDSIDDFITKLSDSLGLPESKYWVANGPYRVVKCSAFEVDATNLNRQGLIRLRSNGYEDTVRQRATAEEERLRREFRP